MRRAAPLIRFWIKSCVQHHHFLKPPNFRTTDGHDHELIQMRISGYGRPPATRKSPTESPPHPTCTGTVCRAIHSNILHFRARVLATRAACELVTELVSRHLVVTCYRVLSDLLPCYPRGHSGLLCASSRQSSCVRTESGKTRAWAWGGARSIGPLSCSGRCGLGFLAIRRCTCAVF